MFTKEMIEKQLCALGVPTDRPVTVHTSLKAIGEVEGRAEGFLEILKNHVTKDGGLLCIPTHTWHRSFDCEKTTLEVDSDDVCIGTLPKIASTHKEAHRSLNPTHSIAVFGDSEKAEEFIALENEVDTSSDPRGCLGNFIEKDGYILLIGVGQEKNTFLHVVEEMNHVQNRLTDEKFPTTIKLKDGTIVKRPVNLIWPKDIGDVSERYPKLEPAFCINGAIKYGFIGNAKVQLCSARKMYEIFSKIIQNSKNTELFADNIPLSPELYL